MTIQFDKNGILTQNLTEILDEREQNLKPVIGDDFIIDKTTPIGNVELADANNELTIQELISWLIPNQLDANTAEGFFLDCICEKNRIYRKQPQYTTLNLRINGTPNTSFISGDITVSDNISGIYYNLNENVTIDETGSVLANFICQDFGENYPLQTSVFNIETPIIGLDSIILDNNNINLVLGRLTETDDELRYRRMYSVQQTSTNTLGSILANIYSLDGVINATYLENDTENTDSNGLPLKSFEFIVDGGDENAITDVIFINKATGTHAFGSTVIQKKDSENNLYSIGYTKAENINVGMDISVNVKSVQSQTWINNIKNALKEKFESVQKIGASVKDYDYYAVITNFSEITNINSVKIYKTNDTAHKVSQLPIGIRQIAKINVENINITVNVD